MSEEDYYSSDYGPDLEPEPLPDTGVQRDDAPKPKPKPKKAASQKKLDQLKKAREVKKAKREARLKQEQDAANHPPRRSRAPRPEPAEPDVQTVYVRRPKKTKPKRKPPPRKKVVYVESSSESSSESESSSSDDEVQYVRRSRKPRLPAVHEERDYGDYSPTPPPMYDQPAYDHHPSGDVVW